MSTKETRASRTKYLPYPERVRLTPQPVAFPATRSSRSAVSPASGSAAAVTAGTFPGSPARDSAGTHAYSAQPVSSAARPAGTNPPPGTRQCSEREDLAIIWLHLDGDRVIEARHCVVCQPHGPVIDAEAGLLPPGCHPATLAEIFDPGYASHPYPVLWGRISPAG
jgi:hypothetical protein